MKFLKMEEKLLNEILDETLAYYDSEDKLAKDKNNSVASCFYLDVETGNQCAVGRYFTEDIVKELKEPTGKKPDLHEAIHGDVYDFEAVMPIDSVLIDRVRGVSIKFWNELQQLHDSVLFKHESDAETNRFVKGIRESIKKGKYADR